MAIQLHRQYAPADTIRVWLGISDSIQEPKKVQWFLDGVAANSPPRTEQPLSSVRQNGWFRGPPPPRVFSGSFTFGPFQSPANPQLAPAPRVIRVEIDHLTGVREIASVFAETTPAALSRDPYRKFNLLLMSCYYFKTSPAGMLEETIRGLPAPYRPHLSLFTGDQVYLDLPTFEDFANDPVELAARFEKAYSTNWFGALGRVMKLAPAAFIPDDHEYWNNYPEASPWVQNSWSDGGRENWTAVARHMLERFQHNPGLPPIRLLEIDLDPVYLILADTRTFRKRGRSGCLHPNALQQLRAWARRVADARGFGVVVTSQSLLGKRVNAISGRIGDWALANYDDYGEILDCVDVLRSSGRPALLLSGDVHWGRIVELRDGSGRSPSVWEVICSPSSLVATPVADQFAKLLHRSDPFPRHSKASEAPERFNLGGRSLAGRLHHEQRGDQIAILSLRPAGVGVEIEVTYWPIHSDPIQRRPGRSEKIRLIPR